MLKNNALEGKKEKQEGDGKWEEEEKDKEKEANILILEFRKQSKVPTWILTPGTPLGVEELNDLFWYCSFDVNFF